MLNNSNLTATPKLVGIHTAINHYTAKLAVEPILFFRARHLKRIAELEVAAAAEVAAIAAAAPQPAPRARRSRRT